MKKNSYKHLLLLTICMLSFTAFATPIEKQEFKREVTKNVKINGSAELNIRTEFASVEIENWDKNEVDVRIEVNIEARNEDEADEIFKKLKLSIDGGGESVELIANLGNSKSNQGRNNNNDGWTINVYIKAPKSISLDVDMSFGDLTLNEINGESDFEISFGSLNAERLDHSNNDVFIEFGDGDISYLGAEEIEVSFGSLTLKRLLTNSEISNSYGDVSIKEVDEKVDDLELNCSFGNIDVTLSNSNSFSIDTFSSFGDVDLDRGIEVIKKEKEMFSEEIEAKVGSGAGRLKIQNSYGEVNVDLD